MNYEGSYFQILGGNFENRSSNKKPLSARRKNSRKARLFLS
jgi:hypothetical protein